MLKKMLIMAGLCLAVSAVCDSAHAATATWTSPHDIAQEASWDLPLIPYPQEIKVRKGAFHIDGAVPVLQGDVDGKMLKTLD